MAGQHPFGRARVPDPLERLGIRRLCDALAEPVERVRRGCLMADEQQVAHLGHPGLDEREHRRKRGVDQAHGPGVDLVALEPLPEHAARGQPCPDGGVVLRGEQRGHARAVRVGRLRHDEVVARPFGHEHLAGVADDEVDVGLVQRAAVDRREVTPREVRHAGLDLDDVDARHAGHVGQPARGRPRAQPDHEGAPRRGVQQRRQEAEHHLRVGVAERRAVGLAVDEEGMAPGADGHGDAGLAPLDLARRGPPVRSARMAAPRRRARVDATASRQLPGAVRVGMRTKPPASAPATAPSVLAA